MFVLNKKPNVKSPNIEVASVLEIRALHTALWASLKSIPLERTNGMTGLLDTHFTHRLTERGGVQHHLPDVQITSYSGYECSLCADSHSPAVLQSSSLHTSDSLSLLRPSKPTNPWNLQPSNPASPQPLKPRNPSPPVQSQS